MQTGLAPIEEATGLPYELNHVPPQREEGLYNFNIVTAQEHADIDPFKFLGN